MNNGVFALLDCLGFKGIWKDHSAESVAQKLELLEDWLASSDLKEWLGFVDTNPSHLTSKVLLLSDTIAVSITVNESSEMPAMIPVGLAVRLVGEINRRFLVTEPNLLLRGCITFGEHLVKDRIIIGPAVDRAAEYEKIPNGAFIWLEPAVAHEYEMFRKLIFSLDSSDPNHSAVRQELSSSEREGNDNPVPIINYYNMPIKGGDRIVCSLLNPFYDCEDWDEVYTRHEIYKRRLTNDRIDVMVKKVNTLEFLSHCDRVTTNYLTARDNYRLAMQRRGIEVPINR